MTKSKDGPEQITMCLNCKRPRCTNCVEHRKVSGGEAAEKKKKQEAVGVRGREDEFYKLYNLGHSDNEIAKALKIPRQNVTSFRNRRGLALNKKRIVEVVQCKHCVHRKQWHSCLGKKDDDFCSYGERERR